MNIAEIISQLMDEICAAQKKHPTASFKALVEEIGEVAKACQEETIEEYRAELIQVATVAVRLVRRSYVEKRWRKH